MADPVTDAAVAAISAAVADAIAESIAEAVAAGASEAAATVIAGTVEAEATEAATAAVATTTADLVASGVSNDVAGTISTYLICPAMSLGEGTLQQFVNSFLNEGLAFVAAYPGVMLLQLTPQGQEPPSATEEEKAKEKAYWEGLLDKAKEKVIKEAAPGVQSYIQKGYKDSLNAAKAENTTWLNNEKKDIMLKGLIPIYGQIQAGIRLSNLKDDAMKQFHAAANSHLTTFLHSQECREKWGKSFKEEGDKFLQSDEWKKMVDDWKKQHPNNPDNKSG